MKKERIEIRVSNLEKKLIEKNASNSGLQISEFLRQLALGYEPKFRLTDEEIEIYKMLHKYVQNFINISNMYKGRNTSINDEVRFVISEIKNHLTKFQNNVGQSNER